MSFFGGVGAFLFAICCCCFSKNNNSSDRVDAARPLQHNARGVQQADSNLTNTFGGTRAMNAAAVQFYAEAMVGSNRVSRDFDVTFPKEGRVGINIEATSHDAGAETFIYSLVVDSMAMQDPELRQHFDEQGLYRRRGVVIVLTGCGGQWLQGMPFNAVVDTFQRTPRPLTLNLRLWEPTVATTNPISGATVAQTATVTTVTAVDAGPQTGNQQTLEATLVGMGLSHYTDKLREIGCTETAHLADLEEADMVEIGMKKLECKRLVRSRASLGVA